MNLNGFIILSKENYLVLTQILFNKNFRKIKSLISQVYISNDLYIKH